MKKTILLMMSVFSILGIQAQVNYSVDTVFYNYFPKDSSEHHKKLDITNTSTTDSVTVTYIKTNENLLGGWIIGGVCDVVACYDNPSVSKSFKLAPSQSAFFYVGMRADQEGGNGCSEATYKFTNSSNADTKFITFKYCAWPASTKNFESSNAVNIYPNPASSYVNIALNDKDIVGINVLNVIGRKIAHFNVDASRNSVMRVPLENIANGIYLLQFTNNEGKILGVRRITVN